LVSASYPSTHISSPMIISEWNFGSLSSIAHVDRTYSLLTQYVGQFRGIFHSSFKMLWHGAKFNSQNVSSVQFSTWQ
jgi:hypothetical protein